MRRALFCLLLLVLLPVPGRATAPPGAIDAIGMIDYKNHPPIRVGSWVKYRTSGTSLQGHKTDYTVTILIAGEEHWWGEDCFWVETTTSYGNDQDLAAASLLSYAVFDDSLPSIRFRRYIRKYIEGYDQLGEPQQHLYIRAGGELTTRGYEEGMPPTKWDTLGVDTVTVPGGSFKAWREGRHVDASRTSDLGDSTIFYEIITHQIYWRTKQVPITGLAKIDMVETQKKRAWLPGHSANVPLQLVEEATGNCVLVDHGENGQAHLIPERFRRPLSLQRAGQPRSLPAGGRKPAIKRS